MWIARQQSAQRWRFEWSTGREFEEFDVPKGTVRNGHHWSKKIRGEARRSEAEAGGEMRENGE